ncbi:MAG: GntR family transcriptional regulator [Atopobiaceae bacterium]|nr:GntR family transcriptional regulator [Atopobiaceae bacterium]
MEIVISNSSDKPISEQTASQIREQVLAGMLVEGEQLPSIRSLATQLRISAITTKRAYQDLEAQGFIHTVPGKGCFVAGDNLELLREERLRQVEISLARAVSDARTAGVSADELREMLDLLLEEDDQR